MRTIQFHIQIKHLDSPPVWRRLLVAEDVSFHDFHVIIQIAFGWEDDHMYMFSKKGYGSTPRITLSEYEDPEEMDSPEVKLSEIFTQARQTYMYIYDFGDDWKHDIKLEKILKEPILYPTCTGGEGVWPIENSGWPLGYMNMLAVTSDPAHPDYEDQREWMGLEDGQNYDPDYFNPDEINQELRETFGEE